jgi:uncharacterized protein (DUF952 family)
MLARRPGRLRTLAESPRQPATMEQKSLQEPVAPIYHMLEATTWTAQPDEDYCAASLASEGFIHCSGDPDTLLQVANAFYRYQPGDWLVLVVDSGRLHAPLRWDRVGDREFPHLYGPLNRDAVVGVLPMPRAMDGNFELPAWPRNVASQETGA